MWPHVSFVQPIQGMLREEHEQEDRSSSSVSSKVAAIAKQDQPLPVLVHNGEDESGTAEVGARIIMTGRVGIATAPASKISCDDANCTKTPSYGYDSDRRRRRCCSHKLEDMVYLKRRKCAEPDCTRLSAYGRSGEGARFCLVHKTPDMVDLANRRCETLGCNRRPVFAIAGQKARLCSEHRKVDMTDVANHLCSAFRCDLKACWGLPGRRATVCFIHRTDEMQKKGGRRSGTSSRRSWRSISNTINASDEVKPNRVPKYMPTQLRLTGGAEGNGPPEAMETARSYSASGVVEEEPIPVTHSSREWMLPVGMIRTRDELAAAVSAFMSRNGDLVPQPQPFIVPPDQHLHQHFQHPSPQSSVLSQAAMHQRAGEGTSMHNGAHRVYADQQLNHSNPIPATAASFLLYSRLQHQPTPCYSHLFPSNTVAEPYSPYDNVGSGRGVEGFSSALQVGVGLGPMLIDSRVQQHQHAALQLQQMQHHIMHQMHNQLRPGAMFRPVHMANPIRNGGEHSSSDDNSTIDKRLQMHADGMSRQAQGATSSFSRSQLPSMAEMLSRVASESGSSGESIDGSDSGKMHM